MMRTAASLWGQQAAQSEHVISPHCNTTATHITHIAWDLSLSISSFFSAWEFSFEWHSLQAANRKCSWSPHGADLCVNACFCFFVFQYTGRQSTYEHIWSPLGGSTTAKLSCDWSLQLFTLVVEHRLMLDSDTEMTGRKIASRVK